MAMTCAAGPVMASLPGMPMDHDSSPPNTPSSTSGSQMMPMLAKNLLIAKL